MFSAKLKPLHAEILRDQGNLCSFGVTEGIAAALVTAGVGAETAGIVAPILLGAGGGALTSGIEGGNPLEGALVGGATGGLLGPAVGAGSSIGDSLGIGAIGGDALVGAGVGAIGSAAFGQNPLVGAAEGGIGGAATGLISGSGASGPSGSSGTPASGIAGGGSSAAATAIPGIAPSGAATDLTSGVSLGDATQALNLGPTGAYGGGGGGVGLGNITGGGAGAISGGTGSGIGAPTSLPTDAQITSGFSTPDLSNIGASAPGVNVSGGGSGGGALDFLSKNANLLIPAAGLGFEAIKGSTTDPTTNELKGLAQSLGGQGSMLSSYIQTGKLPPGVGSVVDQQTQAAEAQTRSAFANLGLSGSSMEAEAISSVKQQAAVNTFNIADKLLQQGIQESQLSGELYQAVISQQTSESNALTEAIAQFAGAAAGGYKFPTTNSSGTNG